MNETATNGTIKVPEYVRDALSLMREFTEKLTAIVEASRAWIFYVSEEGGKLPDARHPLPEELENSTSQLSPAVTELARSVSGMIEHGRVEGLEKINLRLRLAELEAAIHNANALSNKAHFEYTFAKTNKSNRKK